MRDRSWRRGRRELTVARARKRILDRDSRFGGVNWWDDHMDDLAAAAGRAARTPHPCSRYCCGNPRRHWAGFERLTMQEHRANLSMLEQVEDADNGLQDTNEHYDCSADAVGQYDSGLVAPQGPCFVANDQGGNDETE
jgi:hypothetical protein